MTTATDSALLKVAADMTAQANAIGASTREKDAEIKLAPAKQRKLASRSGQVIPRGENRWLVRVFQGRDDKGKRLYSNKTVRGTKKDAEKWLNKALRDKDLGIYVEPSAETVSQFLAKWLETIAKTRVSERTFQGYEWHLGLAKRELGDKRLSALRALDIQRFYSTLTPSNAKHVHAPFSSALSQAVKWNLIHVNPCDAVELPRHKAKEMYAFSRDEAARFLAVPDKYQTLFAFAIDSGARPSEVLALKWSDLDLDRATVTIQRTLQKHKGKGKGWYFSEPKTRKSRRQIPLTAGIVRQLREYRVNRCQELLSWGVRSDLVFCSDTGTPLVLENLAKRHFKPILKAAKIPARATLYSLRHTCATLLLTANVHPKVVAERLGHSSVSITMDVYSHVLPGMQSEATAQLERMLYG